VLTDGRTEIQVKQYIYQFHSVHLADINMNETKVMISGEQQKVMQKAVRWSCGTGVGNNSIQCTSYQKWVHRKCSGIKGSMYKVMKTFLEVA